MRVRIVCRNPKPDPKMPGVQFFASSEDVDVFLVEYVEGEEKLTRFEGVLSVTWKADSHERGAPVTACVRFIGADIDADADAELIRMKAFPFTCECCHSHFDIGVAVGAVPRSVCPSCGSHSIRRVGPITEGDRDRLDRLRAWGRPGQPAEDWTDKIADQASKFPEKIAADLIMKKATDVAHAALLDEIAKPPVLCSRCGINTPEVYHASGVRFEALCSLCEAGIE